MLWRRETTGDTWHFCINCPKWPKDEHYIEVTRTPYAGKMCQECQALKANGDCTSEPPAAKSN